MIRIDHWIERERKEATSTHIKLNTISSLSVNISCSLTDSIADSNIETKKEEFCLANKVDRNGRQNIQNKKINKKNGKKDSHFEMRVLSQFVSVL